MSCTPLLGLLLGLQTNCCCANSKYVTGVGKFWSFLVRDAHPQHALLCGDHVRDIEITMASSGELPDMSGYWKLKKNDENFEKYLQANGINFVLRKVIKSATMYQDIEQDGNRFKIKIIMPVGQQDLEFTVGEAFETYNSFRKVTLHRIANWDGQAMVMKSAKPGDDEPEEKRELVDGALCLTLTKGGVSTKRIFEKAEKK